MLCDSRAVPPTPPAVPVRERSDVPPPASVTVNQYRHLDPRPQMKKLIGEFPSRWPFGTSEVQLSECPRSARAWPRPVTYSQAPVLGAQVLMSSSNRGFMDTPSIQEMPKLPEREAHAGRGDEHDLKR